MPFNFLGKEYVSIKDFVGKNKKALAALVLVALIVIILIVQSALSGRQWRVYESETLGFSLSHPDGWDVIETDAESGPDILVLDSGSGAFVRIRGFVDSYLDSEKAITSSVAEYRQALALQEGVEVFDFQTEEVKNDIGGFWLAGKFPVSGKTFRFTERGWLSLAGQALILRAADAPESFEENLPVMQKIMDSFTIN